MDADLQQMIASLSTEEEPTLSSVEARLEQIFSDLPFFMEDGDFSGADAEEAVEAPPQHSTWRSWTAPWCPSRGPKRYVLETATTHPLP